MGLSAATRGEGILRLGAKAALGSASAVAFLTVGSPASANPCDYSAPTLTVTCTGSPDTPISYNTVVSVTISDLSTPLTPATGTAVATIVNQGSPAMNNVPGSEGMQGAITYSDENHGFATVDASGLTLDIIAGPGGNGTGNGGNDSIGAPGQTGGVGQSATINVSAPDASVSGTGAYAIKASSTGGVGGAGNPSPFPSSDITGGASGAGGTGGATTATISLGSLSIGQGAGGVFAQSQGGLGGSVGSTTTVGGNNTTGSAGGAGGAAGATTATLSLGSVTVANAASGVSVISTGGAGGAGGGADSEIPDGQGLATGGVGGAGGAAGNVSVTGKMTISGTTSNNFVGLLAQSVGGAGGVGGTASGSEGSKGGAGGAGGAAGAVAVGTSTTPFQFSADLSGDQTRALAAVSYGGAGGDGGASENDVGLKGKGGGAAGGGAAGNVDVYLSGNAATAGTSSDAIVLQSIGGFDGSGSSYGSGDQSFGTGGNVTFVGTLTAAASGYGISTAGYASDAIVAQSIGGGGGKPLQEIGLTGLGGNSLAGGDGGSVGVTLSGAAIQTTQGFSRGIYADSVGGGGGNGGASAGISTIGAAGGTGGNGGAVTVQTSTAVSTFGNGSDAIFAASRGGGGGSAVSQTGAFSIGGQAGGGGGAGGTVNVNFLNSVTTAGADADAITAQSVGGGGGDGANAAAGGVIFVQAIGGQGGQGGGGGTAMITQTGSAQGQVATTGDRSRGVIAQSVGGGGGHGGTAVAATAITPGYEHAVGGKGGTGGNGAAVQVQLVVPVTTQGDLSDGVFAQSIGGGGGAAGGVIDAEVADAAVQNSVGGSGGFGGAGAAVTVSTQGAVSTSGHHAAGVVAQAIGGGGGHSGIVVNGSVGGIPIGVAVGGTGGSGGNVTGTVSVATGAVSTQGHGSIGILARSIGGGGGHAGTVLTGDVANEATFNVDLGATGGNGGQSNEVDVTANGAVSTKGDSSTAISAISAGGGGGSGSIVVAASAVAAGNIGVSIGGDGGAGGGSGKVSVKALSDIETQGAMSDGIYAVSIAGYGGDAGISLGSSGTTNVASVADVSVSIGGNGGVGGQAGDVMVSTSGNITTAGLISSAIYAQSVGGGGGRARGTVVANVADVGNLSVAVGGAGGTGGQAGAVTVTTTDANTRVSTDGALSHAIVAQSIGGAGGAGGFAGEFSLNIGTPATEGLAGQVGIAIGGGGGGGGKASTVTVQNASEIQTTNFDSIGILAQSIGGNGGTGGNVYAGNVTASTGESLNLNVDIGGAGGKGGVSDAVSVTNTGAISTESFFSTAIVAQSISGNGGSGGSAYVVLGQYGAGGNANLQVTLGGDGGGSGQAGDVTVSNEGALTTKGGAADGIFAQSIGGNGGRGGSAAYLGINPTLPSSDVADGDGPDVSFNINVGVGGNGAEGAHAGAVQITNGGDITTYGVRSRGIVAQSIGGGGGDGGTASATSFAAGDVCNLLVGGTYVCPVSDEDGDDDGNFSLNSTVQVGGGGAGGGDGSTVKVDNSGNITTQGQLAHGIYAQSIGGGGGNGGEGALGIEAWTSNENANTIANLPSNFMPSFSSIDMAIGGNGKGGGDGDDVSVTNSGIITILGPDASYLAKYTAVQGGISGEAALPFLAGGAGIFAQSVGGGGGDGGAGSSGLSATLTLGNSGGGGGDGGVVTVNSTGAITNTSGYNGTGIFAQSVGGGGGIAGDVGLGFSDSWADLNIGVGLAIVEGAGAGGDGGAVTVTSGGAIQTTGTASIGIFAQSVGGGGGVAAVKSANPKDTIYAGSGGAAGNGGDVSVTNNAAVSVSGTGSVGIVALSTSGVDSGDTSGTVTVNVNADVGATGQGGRAILVSSDSQALSNTGTVAINIAQDVTVSTGAGSAETIGIRSAGEDSALTNLGTITSGNAASYAIRIDVETTFQVQNYGTIDGSIYGKSIPDGQSSGEFQFDNDGLMNTGLEITLEGVLSDFNSTGTLSPGGVNAIAATTITSNFITLDAASIYLADFDPSSPVSGSVVDADMLTLVANTAGDPGLLTVADAFVTPNVVLSNPGTAQRSGSAYILESASAYDVSDFAVVNTPTVTYGLSTSTGVEQGMTTLVLTYDIDTTPWAGAGEDLVPDDARNRINRNHDRFGSFVDALVFGNAAPGAEPFVGLLGASVLNTKTYEELLDIYDGYLADEAFAVPDATFLSALSFSDELFSCGRRDASGNLNFGQQGECAWGRVYGTVVDVSQSKEGPSYTETTVGLSMGGQFELGPQTFLGAAAAIEAGSLDLDGGEASVSRYLAGLTLKHDFGPVMLAGSLEAGFFDSSLERSFSNGVDTLIAQSDPDGYHLAAHVRASHRFDLGTMFVEPVADVGITWLRQNAFTETGAGDFSVSVSKLEETIYSFNPYLNVGGTLTLGEMASQIEFRAGLLALSGGDPSLQASFVGTGQGGPSLTIENRRTNLFADLGAGIETQLSETMSLRGEVDSLIAKDQFMIGGRIRLNHSF